MLDLVGQVVSLLLKFDSLIFNAWHMTPTYLLADSFATVALEALAMVAVFLTPFAVFALLVHGFERVTQRRLAERFGWNAVLWTGWLGTPVHELSHVAMCWVFRHRINEVALFEPDPESGRLGYVHHSYRKENWFENLGNLFIGIAPLIGGSLALVMLLWIFYPQAANNGLAISRPDVSPTLSGLMAETLQLALHIGREIFAPQNWITFRFWLFLYLVLCVGSHMAPSRSDYHGAARGLAIALIALFGVTFLLALANVPLNKAIHTFLKATGPLFAILSLTVGLCGLATLLVYLATAWIRPKYRVA
jgi:hypothetical protein